jgi:NTP pyrophosphatase (non-canonical NTP hydrolase)
MVSSFQETDEGIGTCYQGRLEEQLLSPFYKSMLVVYLSVTLRDAQHLCWKNFRKINDKLDPERGNAWTPFIMITDLLEEAGKVAAVVKGLEGFKPLEKLQTKEMLATQLSDLLYIIFVLAEHYGIELEESFLQTVNDYIISRL